MFEPSNHCQIPAQVSHFLAIDASKLSAAHSLTELGSL